MAKILYGGGIANVSGSEAGTVHSHNKGGKITRRRSSPTNPATKQQQAQRARISNFAKEWVDALTQLQRDAWIVFASEHPVIDSLGQSILLSGFQTYQKLNTRIAIVGRPQINEPPIDQIVLQLTTADPTVDVGAGGFFLAFSPSPMGANNWLQIFSSAAISPGRSTAAGRMRLITNAEGIGTPYDFLQDWFAIFGALPPVGRKIITMTRVLNDERGAISVPVRGETIVVET